MCINDIYFVLAKLTPLQIAKSFIFTVFISQDASIG